MDTIIEKLLTIESEAQEAINQMANEEARIRQKAQFDLEFHITKLEESAGREIEELRKENEEKYSIGIKQIQEKYRQKADEFYANTAHRREKVFNDILYG